MAGITSIGAYIPLYRLSLDEITKFWRIKGAAGEKAVAGYDEDSLTMAVAAALDAQPFDALDQLTGLHTAAAENALVRVANHS